MECPKCGKKFTERPAISRIDSSLICPMCGSLEAMDDAGWTEADQEKIIKVMKRFKWRNHKVSSLSG